MSLPENSLIGLLLLYLLAINLYTLLLFGWDKRQAVRHRRRIPERTLLLLSAVGGAVGGGCGMLLFRHKTRHLKFVLGVPTLLFLQLLLLFWLGKP